MRWFVGGNGGKCIWASTGSHKNEEREDHDIEESSYLSNLGHFPTVFK